MMTAQTICLAILNLQDATGYEIRKCVSEGAFSLFVEASYGSIYPALAKMEATGLLSVRTQEQVGKPNRRVYSITPSGREELRSVYAKPTRADSYRSEFMFLAMFAAFIPRATISKALDDQTERLTSDIATVSETANTAPSPAARWVAACGLSCLQAQLNYILQQREQLLAIAKDAPSQPSINSTNAVAAE